MHRRILPSLTGLALLLSGAAMLRRTRFLLAATCLAAFTALPAQAALFSQIEYEVTGGTFAGPNLVGPISGGTVVFTPTLSLSAAVYGRAFLRLSGTAGVFSATWASAVAFPSSQFPSSPGIGGWAPGACRSGVAGGGLCVPYVQGPGALIFYAGPTAAGVATFFYSTAFGSATQTFHTFVVGNEVLRMGPACDDGVDNDRDGLVDADDPGCGSADDDSERDAALPCDNGLDDDADGGLDFDPTTLADPATGLGDPGCSSPSAPRENPQCQDGLNNDNQLGTDFDGGESILGVGNGDPNGADPHCTSFWDKNEAPPASGGACGLGPELVLLLPLLGAWRARRPGWPSSSR